MKASGVEISDLHYGKMECLAAAYDALQEKIAAENRVRTPHEDRKVTLWKIEQEISQEKWADARREEGHDIKAFNALKYPARTTTLRIKNKGSRPAIYLYGEIGAKYGGVTAADFQHELTKIPNDQAIDLHVNSPGGTYTEGLAIKSLLASRPGPVIGHVDGLAASAATIVLMGADKIVMSRGSMWMIHFSQATVSGPAEDLETAAELLRDANEAILECYMPRWKGTRSELRAALEKETWYSAEAAVAAGFADSVGVEVAIAAQLGRQHEFRNIPSSLTIAAHGAYRPNMDRMEMRLHRAICV